MLSLLLGTLLASCAEEPEAQPEPETPDVPMELRDNLIICNEGNWQSDNGQLSYYDAATGTLTNQWFRAVNGIKLGDTPNDILQVNDTLIAIAVNWSNIIQYIHPDGTACGATENVPNNRRMCSDGRYLYVTSYAHKCGTQTLASPSCFTLGNPQASLDCTRSTSTFEKGYVAKIDLQTKQVVATCATGWEPEGIRLYDGRLYVANTGGYAFSENHDYESTVQVIDAETMQTLRLIDTGCINLCGEMSQAGQWLCLSSGGDYYYVSTRTVVIDCQSDTFRTYDFPSTCNTTDGTLFYTLGMEFSYLTGETTHHLHTINPATGEVADSLYNKVVTEKLRELQSPYALYVSPHTGSIYFTDARSHATAGRLYGYTPQGDPIFAPQQLYINPGHILALPCPVNE